VGIYGPEKVQRKVNGGSTTLTPCVKKRKRKIKGQDLRLLSNRRKERRVRSSNGPNILPETYERRKGGPTGDYGVKQRKKFLICFLSPGWFLYKDSLDYGKKRYRKKKKERGKERMRNSIREEASSRERGRLKTLNLNGPKKPQRKEKLF